MPADAHSRLSHQTNAATTKPACPLSPLSLLPPSPFIPPPLIPPPPFSLLEHHQAASYPPSVHTAREKSKLNVPPLPTAYPANPPPPQSWLSPTTARR